jgi:hypothetical protein
MIIFSFYYTFIEHLRYLKYPNEYLLRISKFIKEVDFMSIALNLLQINEEI